MNTISIDLERGDTNPLQLIDSPSDVEDSRLDTARVFATPKAKGHPNKESTVVLPYIPPTVLGLSEPSKKCIARQNVR